MNKTLISGVLVLSLLVLPAFSVKSVKQVRQSKAKQELKRIFNLYRTAPFIATRAEA